MKYLRIFITFLIFICADSIFAGYWIEQSEGQIPANAWRISLDRHAVNAYLCRAYFQSGLFPGQIKPGQNGCRISYDGKEETINSYQIYAEPPNEAVDPGHWTKGWNSWIPDRAWRIGYDINGQPLHVCIAKYHGLHLGKIRRAIGGCDITYKGKEKTLNQYWVYEKEVFRKPKPEKAGLNN